MAKSSEVTRSLTQKVMTGVTVTASQAQSVYSQMLVSGYWLVADGII